MLEPVDFQKHLIVVILMLAICAVVSLYLIRRIWRPHQDSGAMQRLWWSVVVLIPTFGWMAYGGSFRSVSVGAHPDRATYESGFMTVANCIDLHEAQRLQMRLDCVGIDSFIPDENTANLGGYYLIGSRAGVRVQVGPAEARKARKFFVSQSENPS